MKIVGEQGRVTLLKSRKPFELCLRQGFLWLRLASELVIEPRTVLNF